MIIFSLSSFSVSFIACINSLNSFNCFYKCYCFNTGNFLNTYALLLKNKINPTYILLWIKRMLKFALVAVLIVSTTCYTTSIAHDLAFMSDIAYDSLASINGWNCKNCAAYPVKNQKGFFSSVANIQGYAGYFVKENAVLVAFRGSVDVKNWIHNLETTQTAYPACSGCAVHSGFYSAYKGVAPLLRT